MRLTIQEVSRKLIHLSSLIYPLLYLIFAEREIFLLVIGALLLLVGSLDLLRNFSVRVNKLFCQYLKFTIRESEKKGVTGSTYFLAGVFLTIWLFPRELAIIALCILVISDTCASLIGIEFGKTRLAGNKSLEGFLAFFISALLISWFFGNYFSLPYWPLILAAVTASFAELFSKKIRCDDNILIPLTYALTAYLLTM
jgi:dolichol kinase